MISGFARAGAAMRNAKYVELATDAAKFVERYLFDKKKGVLLRSCYRGENDRILQTWERAFLFLYPDRRDEVRWLWCNDDCRSVPINGFHDDYAFVVKGLLDLYQANFDVHWLEFAEQLQDIQDRLFWDSQDGGYFSTVEDSQMILRMKDGTIRRLFLR